MQDSPSSQRRGNFLLILFRRKRFYTNDYLQSVLLQRYRVLKSLCEHIYYNLSTEIEF